MKILVSIISVFAVIGLFLGALSSELGRFVDDIFPRYRDGDDE